MKLKKYSLNLSYRNVLQTTVIILSASAGVAYGKNFHNEQVLLKQFNYANAQTEKGNINKAVSLYNEILRSRTDLPHVYFNLGVAYMQAKKYHEAIQAFESALRLKKDYPKAAYNLAQAYNKIKNAHQAKLRYLEALEQDPSLVDALVALAKLYIADDQLQEAISMYTGAVELQPNSTKILLDFANTLNMANRSDEALAVYQKLNQMIPSNPAVIYNIGFTLKKLNRIDEALPYYKKTLEIHPAMTEAHVGYGLALLISGSQCPERWIEGWSEYEWRWRKFKTRPQAMYSQPVWNGSDLHGKTLFLWHEQGLGDSFEFIRYAKVAKEMGAHKVIVAVQNPLYDIISLCPYIDQVIRSQEPKPHFDVHAPLLSMPYLTKTRLHTVPQEIPYLYADQELVETWKEKLSRDTKFKIGICWQGEKNHASQLTRLAFAGKSLSVDHFIPIMQMPHVSVYSLQKVDGTEQLKTLPNDAGLIVFGNDFDESNGRFMDTAAVIKNLDLIITVDTSVCHLAGGLGTPTWLILPNPADWRWMLDCDSTPWYPNMKLYRQRTPGDWHQVIQDVVQALNEHFEHAAPLISFTHPCGS